VAQAESPGIAILHASQTPAEGADSEPPLRAAG
jgi:hypothetical protein